MGGHHVLWDGLTTLLDHLTWTTPLNHSIRERPVIKTAKLFKLTPKPSPWRFSGRMALINLFLWFHKSWCNRKPYQMWRRGKPCSPDGVGMASLGKMMEKRCTRRLLKNYREAGITAGKHTGINWAPRISYGNQRLHRSADHRRRQEYRCMSSNRARQESSVQVYVI